MGAATRKRLLWLGIGLLGFSLSQADSPAISDWKTRVAQALLQHDWSAPAPAAGVNCPHRSAGETCLVARISIPGQRAARIVMRQPGDRAPAGGWGHLVGTPLPGAVGNTVFRIYAPKDGALLQRLRRGDALVVELADASQFVYRVTGARVADRRAIRVDYDTDGAQLTLISRPPGVARGDMWLVVNATLLPAPRTAALSPALPIARLSLAAPTA